MAIVPPPMMASDRGSAGNVTASTLVMNPTSRSPGMRGDECPHAGGQNHRLAPQDVSLDR